MRLAGWCWALGWLTFAAAGDVAAQTPLWSELRAAKGTTDPTEVRWRGDPRRLMRTASPETSRFTIPTGAGATLTGEIELTRIVGPNRFVSSGRLGADPAGEFLCVVDDGRLAGVFAPSAEERWLILPTATTGKSLIWRTKNSALPAGRALLPSDRVAGGTPLADSVPNEPPVIDVLILYTREAQQLAGGGNVGIEAVADLAVQRANQAYQQSGVDAVLRLVHTARIDYVESGVAATDLEVLTRAADGIMDDAITLRRDFRADLVHLFIGNADQPALGWLNNFSTFNPTWTFSVSMPIFVQNDVFTRAIGSNQGLDFDFVTPSQAVFPFSFGYSFNGQSGQRFSTIMSNGPNRISRHSNPFILFDGVPMGRPVNDPTPAFAAQSLNDTAETIAAIADGIIVPPPVISSAATATGVVNQAFTYQIMATNGPKFFAAAGLPSGLNLNSTTGLISGAARQAGVYRVDLTATNDGGDGVKVLTITINEPDDCPLQRLARQVRGSPGLWPFSTGNLDRAWLDPARRFRDDVLKRTPEGTRLIAHYYRHGPKWLARLEQDPVVIRETIVVGGPVLMALASWDGREPLVLPAEEHAILSRALARLRDKAPETEREALEEVAVWWRTWTLGESSPPR
jgi:hypothetical protein